MFTFQVWKCTKHQPTEMHDVTQTSLTNKHLQQGHTNPGCQVAAWLNSIQWQLIFVHPQSTSFKSPFWNLVFQDGSYIFGKSVVLCSIHPPSFTICMWKILLQQNFYTDTHVIYISYKFTNLVLVKPRRYLASSLAAAVSDPALHRLQTFEVPNLMSLFRCLIVPKYQSRSEAFCMNIL
jgi:hypothetical protein